MEGHNGLSNIQELLGTTDYSRLRVGIGNDFPKGGQVDYVLGRWTEEQQGYLTELNSLCIEATHQFVCLETSKAMSLVNAKKLDIE